MKPVVDILNIQKDDEQKGQKAMISKDVNEKLIDHIMAGKAKNNYSYKVYRNMRCAKDGSFVPIHRSMMPIFGGSNHGPRVS